MTDPEALYDQALLGLLSYGPEYGDQLSNHGPMAAEALANLGVHDHLSALVTDQATFLEPVGEQYSDVIGPGNGRRHLREHVPALVHKAGSQAGHGLLRTAHAVRALERRDSEPRRRELLAALAYWSEGAALNSPRRLGQGRDNAPGEDLVGTINSLPRLEAHERTPGLLVFDLMTASAKPAVNAGLSRLVSVADDPDQLRKRFETTAAAAAATMPLNVGLEQFALLHGITVSNMATVLIPHLDADARAELEAAVVGFVASAVVAFDHRQLSADEGPDVTVPLNELVQQAVERLDPHYLKLADTVTTLTATTGDPVFARALAVHIS